MKKILWMITAALLGVAATAPQKDITIFLCGDSTMADKPLAQDNRERGWGMYFARFFNDKVRIENHAVNGRSTKSFRTLGHWQTVIGKVQHGDYVIIEFGHNDGKLDDTVRYAGPETDFRANLSRYVEEVRNKGGKPVLYTAISRRKFDNEGALVNTHGRYLDVTREVAAQLQVPLVDLYDSTARWLRQLGVQGSFPMFMNLAPGESLCAPKGKEDNTHLNAVSAPVVAGMAAGGLLQACPELAAYASRVTHHAPSASYYAPRQSKLAFPGADGFGKYTTGGRGGKVVYVTNLNDAGPGSLREALEKTKGVRTVLFTVSGTIHLKSVLSIKHGDVTVAGQSAPGDGICVTGASVKISDNNVIIRYLRFRMGDSNGKEDDALSATRRKNIIIDHCSMSWSTDECASFYDNESFTLQYCLIYESLTNSVHAKGAHGYGGIWGGMGASFHHNLLAHHSSRNPRFCGARYHESTAETEWVDFRNNVIYNWGFNSSYAGEHGQYNIVNNYYKPGPATRKNVRRRILEAWQSSDKTGFHDFGRFYVDGNIMDGDAAVIADNWKGVDYKAYDESLGKDVDYLASSAEADNLMKTLRAGQAFAIVPTHTETAPQAYNNVLSNAGANKVRDALDTRMTDEVREGIATHGKNGLIDSQKDTEGLPQLKSLPAPVDTDGDGMPDTWEEARKLHPEDASDGVAYTLDAAYTNLEVYLNSLVADISPANYDIVVARDGTGHFRNVQEAVNSVRDFRPEGRIRILVKNGVYKEKIIVPNHKTNITLIGESVDKTIITWDDHANIDRMGTFKTYTILIQGDGFEAGNITFENNAPQMGQAVAVHVDADRVVFKNCRLLGNQDTLLTGKAGTRQYYAQCYIEGTTDFIFGPATAWFENCTIHSKKNSFVTAASTPEDIAYGYVFNHCTLTAAPGIEKVYLGRPWRAYAAVLFMHCNLGAHILPEGWENWRNPENEKTARYAEYKNTGPGAAVKGRVAWSRRLSDREAQQYTLENVFARNDQWQINNN